LQSESQDGNFAENSQVWRICKSKYAEKPFSGEGGLILPGRWHRAGHRIVYTSATLSLAAWEVWAHARKRPHPTYISVSAEIPDDLLIEEIEEASLPTEWRSYAPYPTALADMGTDWLERRSSAVLRVPSAITSGEFNYLLNPEHPAFPQIKHGWTAGFVFDARA
jgi:RES domain-containing protein